MEFTSQICTTEEQSKRLLALGLNAETADMSYQVKFFDPFPQLLVDCIPSLLMHPPINDKERFIPAWSLHTLIEICNKSQVGITIDIYNEVFDDTYDNLISIIERLIGLDKFNKKYLDIH